MNPVVDVIVILLFIGILFFVIGGFNREMLRRNKERRERAEKINEEIAKRKEKEKEEKND
jgi:uncharacterized membrane protein